MQQPPLNIEKAYFESEEKYKRLTQLMPVAVYSTNQDGLITFYNKKAAELWGREPLLNDSSELLYCGSWKIYDADGNLIPHDQCPMAKALRKEIPYRGEEICIERPDGTQVYALANIDLLYDMEGRLTGAINVLNDITERKKSEKDTNLLAAIVASSDDAIISKDLNSKIMSWNVGAEKIFGYTEKEMIGQDIRKLIPQSRINEEDIILEKIRKGERLEHFETVRQKKNGDLIQVSITVSPVKNAKGAVIGASKIARDISEQVRTKNQLEEYNNQLKELNRVKDDFLTLASHELKTPVTVIKAYLELLQLEVKEEDICLLIEKSVIQANKLSDLISDLLDISRIEEGKLMLDISRFNINELVDECVDSIQHVSGERQFCREGDLGNISVEADRKRLEQVIINFLTNAVKYSDAGKVVVFTETNDEWVTVKVQDFGIGIPQEQLRNVFSRFFRISDSGKNVSGLGIGLYITKEIIERHNGKIWVESETGKGSVFGFSIPISR